MLRARLLRPMPTDLPITQPSLRSVLDSQLTVVAAHSGFIVVESLARVLRDAGRLQHTAWVRLDTPDTRFDHLIRSLDLGLSELEGEPTVRQPMRAIDMPTPTRDVCWAIGAELGLNTPDATTLVVERRSAKWDARVLIDVLGAWARSSRSRRGVLLWHGKLPRRVQRLVPALFDAKALAVEADAVRDLTTSVDAPWAPHAVMQLARLARGRAALLHDLLDASMEAPQVMAVEALLGRCAGRGAFMRRLSRDVLRDCSADEREALLVAMNTGYWHPDMSRGRHANERPLWPWFAPLESGWWYLRPLWRQALHEPLYASVHRRHRRALGGRGLPADVWRPAAAPAHVAVTETIGPELSDSVAWPAGRQTSRPRAVPTTELASGTPAAPSTQGVHRHALAVQMLGRFDVAIDDHPVDEWHSQRGLLLFKYIALNRRHPVVRDVLTDVFWPDVPPDRSTNRFHVALSGLRRSFRMVSDVPIVVYRYGKYGLNPDINL